MSETDPTPAPRAGAARGGTGTAGTAGTAGAAGSASSSGGATGSGGGGRRRPPPSRGPRGLWGALIAILAVSAGILLVNLLHNPDDDADQATARPSATTTTATTTTASASATASPTASPTATPSAAPTTTSAPATPATRPPTPAGGEQAFAPVVILNNSKVEGLASDARSRVEAAGFTVTRIGGWGGSINVPRTVVLYEKDDLLPAARTLQRLVPGIDEVRKVDPADLVRPAGEHDTLLLVITKYYPNPSPRP